MTNSTVPAIGQVSAVVDGHTQYKPLAALSSNGIRDQRGLKCTRYLTQLQAALPCSARLLQSSILRSSKRHKHRQHSGTNTAYSKFSLVQCRSLSQLSPSLPTMEVQGTLTTFQSSAQALHYIPPRHKIRVTALPPHYRVTSIS